jgi:Alginate export
VYLGVREVIDPVRLAVEFQDSQRAIADRPILASEINFADILQAHLDLHFDDVVAGQSFTASFGRMTFDAVDRRLIARNRFRNAINSFDGLRLRFGAEKDPWEVDAFALQPVLRDTDGFDRSNNNSRLFGVTGYWRRGSPGIQFEPFWLLNDRTRGPGVSLSDNQHTFGVHTFGHWAESRWDYDLSLIGQLGRRGAESVEAWAVHGEVGYTWDVDWQPRLGLWVNAASGDQRPGDGTNQGFDPLYGATFSFYGYTGYFLLNNIISPSVRINVQPTSRIRSELIYRTIWLESSRATWARANRGDPSGQDGDFVGQEVDMRFSYGFFRWLEAEVIYALFLPGSFVANTGPSPLSSFSYLQVTLRF